MKKTLCSIIAPLVFGLLILAFVSKGPYKLIFEQKKYSRSSFCLYSDGKFYHTHSSGCIGQSFSWGYWKVTNDTITLNYSNQDIFKYDIVKSTDSQSNFQIVRIIDCYNQPVRFQIINHDSGYNNLYNIGYLKLRKGNSINYPAPIFNDEQEWESIVSEADTITYQWQCNRESIESINGGRLYIETEQNIKKIKIHNKQVSWLNGY